MDMKHCILFRYDIWGEVNEFDLITNLEFLIQELDRLIQTPVIMNNEAVRADVLYQVDQAMSLLSHSLGIRVAPPSLLSTAELYTGGVEVTLDGALVAALLQTSKGKKLMSRSLQMLPPEHR